jgi:hypothetical protein
MKNLVKMHGMNTVKTAQKMFVTGPQCLSQECCVINTARLSFHCSTEFVQTPDIMEWRKNKTDVCFQVILLFPLGHLQNREGKMFVTQMTMCKKHEYLMSHYLAFTLKA